MKLASIAFRDKHGRMPTQKEWEQYYIAGGSFVPPSITLTLNASHLEDRFCELGAEFSIAIDGVAYSAKVVGIHASWAGMGVEVIGRPADVH
jgi:hypothetical protein